MSEEQAEWERENGEEEVREGSCRPIVGLSFHLSEVGGAVGGFSAETCHDPTVSNRSSKGRNED